MDEFKLIVAGDQAQQSKLKRARKKAKRANVLHGTTLGDCSMYLRCLIAFGIFVLGMAYLLWAGLN